MNKREKRFSVLLEYLEKNHVASVKDFSALLDVTIMTIRRDLIELAGQGKIFFVNGVAVLNNKDNIKTYSLDIEKTSHIEEKIKIGQAAASLIKPRDVIFLDSGTTVNFILKYIPDDFPLTIITNCLSHIDYIKSRENWTLIVPGGTIQRNSYTLVSNHYDFISSVRINKAFISTTGVDLKLGVTCPFIYETELKKIVIKSSIETILVVDSSKFDNLSVAYFADISDFTSIITDSSISTKYISYAEENKIFMKIV